MAEPNIIAGRYQVRKAIGRGARGQVYLAHDPLLNTFVAIKMLHGNGADDAVVRFQNEAVATGKLKHARIAQTLDFGIADGTLYMVMEFVGGESLESLLERQTCLPIERAVPLFIDICAGLAHAHAHGILHRDLKPANVIVVQSEDEGEFAKLVDFGIAKIQGDDHVVTDPNAIVGSPIYMSPEQCRGEVCDARSDLYSLGCLMFETLSGNPPILGDTALDTISLKTAQGAPSLSSVMDTTGMPEELIKIVDTCLKRNTAERFQNASAIEQALEEIVLDPEDEVTSLPESVATKRKIAKSAVFGFIALAAMLAVAGQLMRQILHEENHADSSQLKVLRGVLDTTTFIQESADEFVPTKTATKDNEHDLKSDQSITAAFNLPGGLRSKFSGRGANNFVKDPKHPEVIKATRMARDEEFKSLVGQTQLRTLFIEHARSLTGDAMKYLEKLPLQGIFVNDTMMNDSALEHFSNIPTLDILSVQKAINITDEGLKHLEKLKNLRELSFDFASITNRGVEKISHLKNLEHLELSHCELVTDDCIPAINSMPKLLKVNLSYTGVTATGVTKLARGQKNSISLLLSGLPWTDQSIDALVAMPKLQELDMMEDANITDELLPEFARMRHLECLRIDASHLSGGSLRALKDSPSLSRLALRGPVVSTEMLKSIATLKIRILELHRSKQLYDFQLVTLLGMPNLRFLLLGDCNPSDVTLSGAQAFKKKYSQRWKRDLEVGYDSYGLAE